MGHFYSAAILSPRSGQSLFLHSRSWGERRILGKLRVRLFLAPLPPLEVHTQACQSPPFYACPPLAVPIAPPAHSTLVPTAALWLFCGKFLE